MKECFWCGAEGNVEKEFFYKGRRVALCETCWRGGSRYMRGGYPANPTADQISAKIDQFREEPMLAAIESARRKP